MFDFPEKPQLVGLSAAAKIDLCDSVLQIGSFDSGCPNQSKVETWQSHDLIYVKRDGTGHIFVFCRILCAFLRVPA